MTASVRFAVGGIVVSIVLVYLAFSAASSNWQYYLTVDECLGQADALGGARLRVSGRIASDTLQIAADRSRATFALVGSGATLPVECHGPLPDNLAEAIEVVVEGELGPAGGLRGQRVMTRCASKYRSGEGGRPDPAESRLPRIARRSGG